MAYPYLCDNCLDGTHEECEETKGEGFGVGFCVCSHSRPWTPFEEKVRADAIKLRQTKLDRDRIREEALKQKCEAPQVRRRI